MLTAEGVIEVSFTAEPAVLGNWRLTIDDLIKMTTAADWDSWIRLWPQAAARIASQLNATKPWNRRRQRALAAAPKVIEGVIVDTATVA